MESLQFNKLSYDVTASAQSYTNGGDYSHAFAIMTRNGAFGEC
jgi:hypothetical protein